MQDIDNLILKNIETSFKTVKQISEELNIFYVRVAVRIKQLRKRNEVIFVQSSSPNVKGVKPLKYRKKFD